MKLVGFAHLILAVSLVAGVFVTPCLAMAQDEASSSSIQELENKSYWLCKNKREVRTIRVQINQSGTCSTLYSKHGDEKAVGGGKSHDSCMNYLNNIKTNLEKSNWSCRDITDSKITASVE